LDENFGKGLITDGDVAVDVGGTSLGDPEDDLMKPFPPKVTDIKLKRVHFKIAFIAKKPGIVFHYC
jgi:hypothetical protein